MGGWQCGARGARLAREGAHERTRQRSTPRFYFAGRVPQKIFNVRVIVDFTPLVLLGYRSSVSASGFKFLKPRDEDGVINHGKRVQYRIKGAYKSGHNDTTSTSRQRAARARARKPRVRTPVTGLTGHGTHPGPRPVRGGGARAHKRTRRNVILVRKVRKGIKY